MKKRLFFVFFMVMISAFGNASSKIGYQMDSIRKRLPHLKDAGRIEAYHKIYNLSQNLNNQKMERKCLGDYIREANRQNVIEYVAKARYNLMCYYYNYSMKDSLIKFVPAELTFMRENKEWNNYYLTWDLLINMYIINGRNNTGLYQVKHMYADAVKRKNNFGMALALYCMALAYHNLKNLTESQASYEKCIYIMMRIKPIPVELLEVYSYYCDVLYEAKRYDRMLAVTDQWKKIFPVFLKNGAINVAADELGDTYWMCYYCLSRSQAEMGKGNLRKAEPLLLNAYRIARMQGTMVMAYVLESMIDLYTDKGDYTKALQYVKEELQIYQEMNDDPGSLRVKEQKAVIMEKLHNYKASSDLYKYLYEKQDSVNVEDAKTQLNELYTLFHIDELKVQKQLTDTRNAIVFSIFIIIALVVFIIYRHRMIRKLKQQNQQLVVARDQAQESLRMKSDFIRNISHEIRTPLNILSGFTQVVTDPRTELSSEEKADVNTKILENTDRITTLVNTLLELSESSSKGALDRCDEMSCHQLCVKALERFRMTKDSVKFELVEDVQPDVFIKTNATYMIRAIHQILHNATKFTEQGSITMHTYLKGSDFCISITDTGIGIPAEEAEHIFEEFVQLDDYEEGVGVGLSVSRSIVRRLGGDIYLDTTYHDGARFILTLPLDDNKDR